MHIIWYCLHPVLWLQSSEKLQWAILNLWQDWSNTMINHLSIWSSGCVGQWDWSPQQQKKNLLQLPEETISPMVFDFSASVGWMVPAYIHWTLYSNLLWKHLHIIVEIIMLDFCISLPPFLCVATILYATENILIPRPEPVFLFLLYSPAFQWELQIWRFQLSGF
jgi:hypothetical protein